MQYLSFSIDLLGIMSSGFIHIVSCVTIAFLFKAENIPLYVYTIPGIYIQPWTCEFFLFFCFLPPFGYSE